MLHPSKRRLAAVLFSDIKGYSSQMGANEERTLVRLRQHNTLFRQQVGRHGGRSGQNGRRRLEVRIGVHAGDVVVEDEDLFGETGSLAARLDGKAPPGARMACLG